MAAERAMENAKLRLDIKCIDLTQQKMETLGKKKTDARVKFIRRLTKICRKKTRVARDEFNQIKIILKHEVASRSTVKFVRTLKM